MERQVQRFPLRSRTTVWSSRDLYVESNMFDTSQQVFQSTGEICEEDGTARGFPICLRPSLAFVDPGSDFSLEDWPFQTSVGYDGSTWEMLEFCEDMRMMDKLSVRVDCKYRLLTILTLDVLPPEQIGFATEGHDQASSSSASPAAAQPVQQVQPEQADQGVQAEMPIAEVGGAERLELPPHLELHIPDDVLDIGGAKVYPSS